MITRKHRLARMARQRAECAAKAAECRARLERDYPIIESLRPVADRMFVARQALSDIRRRRCVYGEEPDPLTTAMHEANEAQARHDLSTAAWVQGTRGIRVPIAKDWYITIETSGA